jgi:hypothetical protein
MPSAGRRAVWLFALLAVAATAACTGVLRQEHEYEEELYLSLDGSATVYVNASVAALVALRGADLPVDPRARLDRQRVREWFGGLERNAVVTLSRRDGRRFVHIRIDVDDVGDLPQLAPLAWSTYRLDRRDDVLQFRQSIGASAAKEVGGVDWRGTETVRFKIHLPSEILYENADGDVQRGNILEWEQPLSARLAGEPLLLEAHMATESILRQTLLLFGSMILAAAAVFAIIIWWVARRGREGELEERRQGVPADLEERRQGVPADRRHGVPGDRKDGRQSVPADRAESHP